MGLIGSAKALRWTGSGLSQTLGPFPQTFRNIWHSLIPIAPSSGHLKSYIWWKTFLGCVSQKHASQLVASSVIIIVQRVSVSWNHPSNKHSQTASQSCVVWTTTLNWRYKGRVNRVTI